MTATSRNLTITVDADTTDATRKIRQLGREARRARRDFDGRRTVLQLAGEIVALVSFIEGVVWQSTFHVAVACAVLLVVRR